MGIQLVRLTAVRRKYDCEDCATPTALKQKLALVLADDAVGHEEPETSSGLFGREVRLEKMVTILVGDAWTVVSHAEIGPTV